MKKVYRLFIKDADNVSNPAVRTKYGSFAGAVGIISNIMLGVLKIILGTFTLSPAIVADGVNNATDALSSIITLIGFKIASKDADPDHPFGHQRMEYITGMIVSLLILMIGFTFGKDSFIGLIDLIKGNPAPLNVDNKILIISLLCASIFVKFLQSLFYKDVAKTINSDSLIASSKDSLNDTITTFATLISTIIYIVTSEKVNIDSIAGLVVSVFIIVTGIEMVLETIKPLLGEPPSEEFVQTITSKVLSYEGVLGIHDLVVHSYGPSMSYVTIHVEVSRDVDVMLSHDLIDNIEADFRKDLHIDLTIHMDPVDNNNPLVIELKEKLGTILKNIDESLNYHDFRIVPGNTHTNLVFDVAVPMQFKMTIPELRKEINAQVKLINPTYFCVIQFDQYYNRMTD